MAGWTELAVCRLATPGKRTHGGFFAPRQVYDWFSSKKGISYYDTSALKGTLERLVDLERINEAQDIRLSVGAVNVRTGQFSYFDSVKMPIPLNALWPAARCRQDFRLLKSMASTIGMAACIQIRRSNMFSIIRRGAAG